jgi:hypothetical protein
MIRKTVVIPNCYTVLLLLVVILMFAVNHLSSYAEYETMSKSNDQKKSLIGKWKKVTTTKCSDIYPDYLELLDKNIYFGQKENEEIGGGTWWDSGGYKIVSDNHIRISTANDAQLIYEFSISNTSLTFLDKDGCEFKYIRIEEGALQ